jgi:hypothetical protein
MHINHIKMAPTTGRHAEQVPTDFFYSRVIEKNQEDFQKISPVGQFNEKVRELVREQKEQISKELEEFGEPVSTIAQDVLFPNERVSVGVRGRPPGSEDITTTKYTGDRTENPVLLFLLGEDSHRYRHPDERSKELRISVLSKDSDDGESFLGFFANETQEISTYVGDYATIKELEHGGEIVHDYFNRKVNQNSNLEGWHQDVQKNDFEEEVFEAVREFTGVALPNIRIEVDVGDNPDFDVVALPLGGFSSNYAIEVKDYLQDDNEEVAEAPAMNKDSGELRSELIRKPKEYAEQADLNLITVVKGLSEEQYDNLQRLADSSNVILLNESNYQEELSKFLFETRYREMEEYVI